MAAGLLLTFAGRLPVRLGRLPGDISYHGRNTSFYLPITTCILISVVASLVMWLGVSREDLVKPDRKGRGVAGEKILP